MKEKLIIVNKNTPLSLGKTDWARVKKMSEKEIMIAAKLDSEYPLFVLGGVIMDKAYAEGKLIQEVDNFKLKLFGRKDIVLHTADITRNRSGFEKLIEPSFRENFYEENVAGLQLADLVVTPVGRYVLGKAIKEDFKIIREKFRCNRSKEWNGYGLVVLPK